MNELDLLDVFRELHPTTKKFTWKQWGSTKEARLDYFLISSSLLPFIQNVQILPTCYSDHKPIMINIDFSKFQRGRGFWKLNNSLLYNTNYVDMIKETIKRVTCQYAIINDNHNFFESCPSEEMETFLSTQSPETLQQLQLKINPELFLDTLLMEIRQVSIQFASRLKKARLQDEQELLKDIEILENATKDEALIEELERKKQALEEIYSYQAQGAYIRARATYKIEGERPTKMFCALEKHNGVQKYVPQLIVENRDGDEEVITDQKGVENEIFQYYKNLYKNKDHQNEVPSIGNFFESNIQNIPKLSDVQKNLMEGKISLNELTSYLKKTKNNVSPGSSGFTNEFYKFFWRDLKYFVLNAIEFAFENNRLSITQNLGIISIIPKGEKDKRYLTNWRPLTLLNSLYKLVSGCIAERIKPVLNSIIHPDQKGFVAGRYIGEAIRTTYDIMHIAKEKNLAGLLLCIDFEKAYDSISFKYIKMCLKFFNFGSDLIKWVEILLYDFRAVINHCGNVSNSFAVGRGCRQGDPIASYLFIICIEILALKLRSDPKIEGFKMGNLQHLIEIYADDLTVFLQPYSQNLRNTIGALSNFFMLSGLKISVKKTTAVWFGSECNSDVKLCPDLNLKWSRKFKLLGIDFDNNLENMQDNFIDKTKRIEKMLFSWSYRYLTPIGKVTIVKTLGLSKLSHVALVIPNPNKDMIKNLNTSFFKFIWNKGSEKVSREDAKLPLKNGGLGMPDILKFWTAFKFSWFRRILTSDSFWPKLLESQVNEILGADLKLIDVLQLGQAKLNQVAKSLKNNFWKQVFSSSSEVLEGTAFCFPEKILSSPFMYNNLILRNNKVIKERDFPEIIDKVSTMSDFYKPGTIQLLPWQEFCEKYTCNISQEKFIDIRYILNLSVQKLKISSNRLIPANKPLKPLLVDIALLCSKGCSSYYKILRKKAVFSNKIYLREDKWHNELGSRFSIDFWNNARRLCSRINIDNKLLWLQYQIIRNSLQTNYIVSHFQRNVTRSCQYCQNSDELISHIFWSCIKITDFLQQVISYLESINFIFLPNKTQMLFGFHDLDSTHPKNYMLLIFKRYVWINKFKNCNLTMDGFKGFLKSYVVDLKYIFELKKEAPKLAEWNAIIIALDV